MKTVMGTACQTESAKKEVNEMQSATEEAIKMKCVMKTLKK